MKLICTACLALVGGALESCIKIDEAYCNCLVLRPILALFSTAEVMNSHYSSIVFGGSKVIHIFHCMLFNRIGHAY